MQAGTMAPALSSNAADDRLFLAAPRPSRTGNQAERAGLVPQ